MKELIFFQAPVPGQERDRSNASKERKVKMYEQDEILWKKTQDLEAEQDNMKRIRSMTPIKKSNMHLKGKWKSFVDIMNWGEGRIRVTPTFSSNVFNTPRYTQKVNKKINVKVDKASSRSSTNLIHSQKKNADESRNINTNEKKENNVCDQETAYQRYYKEIHGSKTSSPKKPKIKDIIPSTLQFDQHFNKSGIYEHFNWNKRRDNEFNSCMWDDNGGNYKLFESQSPTRRSKVASNISWLNKNTEVVNNKPRDITPSKFAQEQLWSSVLPLKTYPKFRNNSSSQHNAEHELKNYKRQKAKMKNSGYKKQENSTNSNM